MPTSRHHVAITIPVAAYAGLHALGWKYPAELWGVDQLHYYGEPVQVICGCLLFGLIVLALKPERAMAIDRAVESQTAWITSGRLARRWLPTAICVSIPFLLYAFRVKAHTLGDSVSWFGSVEALVAVGKPPPFTWALESLDFGIHVAVYWLGAHLIGWSARDAYEVLSCLSGAAYVYVTYRIAAVAASRPSERAALIGIMLTLGSVQLFFGYGESYTLVAVMVAVFVWQGFQYLDRGTGWQWPTASLALACALHVMSLCLVPSLLYLLWRDQGGLGRSLRRNSVFVPLLALGGVAAVGIYIGFYQHHHLPLLEPDAPGRYPIVSLSHLGTLANEALLLSPFGLVWGAIGWLRRRDMDPPTMFVGLGALGAGALVTVHNITMGGRDWDLMAFAGLPYVLWGALSLRRAVDHQVFLPCLRVVVVPLMALHTGLWVGINASPEKAQRRLGNLLQYSNQPEDYRYFTQGYYYAAILEEDHPRAAILFQKAVDAADPSELVRPGSRAYSYRKFLASSLARAHRYEEALSLIRQIYSVQTRRFISPNDVALHQDWVMACERQAQLAVLARDTTAAHQYWREGLAAMQILLSHSPTVQRYWNTARMLSRLGKRREAIGLYAEVLVSSPRFGAEMLAAGDGYLEQGHREAAATAYAQVVGAAAGKATHEEFAKAANGLYRLGYLPEAVLGFRKALAENPTSRQVAIDLAWCLQLQGEYGEAIQYLRQLAAEDTARQAKFALGLAYLRSGQVDSARAVYDRVVVQFGVEEGKRIGADANLRWLVKRGEHAVEAREILERYWP